MEATRNKLYEYLVNNVMLLIAYGKKKALRQIT